MDRRAIWRVLVVAGAGLLAPLSLAAEEQTITGEIVDPAMYLKEGHRGAELIDQTYEAVDGGQTLAVLDEATETLYLFLAELPGEDPNELVYDYVNQLVRVTGQVYERAGLRGVVAASVEPLQPPAGNAQAPTPTALP